MLEPLGTLVILTLAAGSPYVVVGLIGESYNFHWLEKCPEASSDDLFTKAFVYPRYFHVPELKHLGSVLKISGSSYMLKSRHSRSWISSYDPLILEKYGKD